jgi:hypothetical protein
MKRFPTPGIADDTMWHISDLFGILDDVILFTIRAIWQLFKKKSYVNHNMKTELAYPT